MRGTTIATVLLTGMLLLQGCAAADQPEPSEPAVSTEQATEQATEPTAAGTAAPSTEASDAAPADYDVRVVHEDADETVMLLDRDQVALAAGVTLTEDSMGEILSALADAGVWEANATTQPHAEQIAQAFSGERDRAQGVLHAMLNNPHAQMKLYVRHAGGENFAHVEVGN